MARGGKRDGAGRPAGAVTKRTREVAEKAVQEGLTPLDYMLTIMRDEMQPAAMRFEAAKAAAPYVHPKLASVDVDHTSSDGSMTPKPALDASKLSTAALAEIMAAADEAPDQG